MHPARSLFSAVFGLLAAAGGTIVTVPSAATAAPAPVVLPHQAGGFAPPSTRVAATAGTGVFGAIPETVNLKSSLPPVGNQGQIGSCVAWTIAHSIMGYYAKRDVKPGAPYAPLYLYMRSVQRGGAPNAGLVPEKALNEAAMYGVDSQDDYLQGTNNYAIPPTAAQVANAGNFKVSGWKTLWAGANQGTAAQTAMKTAISSGAPVAIGMPVYKDFMYLVSGNLYRTTAGVNLGGHMVTAYAYDSEGVWIRNQWGTAWGAAGDAKLAWSFITTNVLAAYTVAGVTTPATVPLSRPIVSTLSQVRGPVVGGTEVSITGGHLSGATAVHFGTTPATFRKVETNGVTTLLATAPSRSKGTVDVTVTNAAGTSSLNSQARFMYQPPPPAVTKLSVASTSVAGGETITVTGANFEDVSLVRIGANATTNVKLQSSTSLTFTVPANIVAGIYDVTVVTPSGISASAPAARLAMVNPPAPTITALSVTSGSTYTTTPIIVTGTGFATVKSVSMGGVGAPFQKISDTQLKVTAPVRTAGGKVTIRVVSLGGAVEGVSVPFTYIAPPAPRVAEISPAAGAARTWNIVEVNGANFGQTTAVTLNGAPVTFTKLSDTRLRVNLPPRAAGAVRIQVVTAGGTSVVGAASTFTYRA